MEISGGSGVIWHAKLITEIPKPSGLWKWVHHQIDDSGCLREPTDSFLLADWGSISILPFPCGMVRRHGDFGRLCLLWAVGRGQTWQRRERRAWADNFSNASAGHCICNLAVLRKLKVIVGAMDECKAHLSGNQVDVRSLLRPGWASAFFEYLIKKIEGSLCMDCVVSHPLLVSVGWSVHHAVKCLDTHHHLFRWGL